MFLVSEFRWKIGGLSKEYSDFFEWITVSMNWLNVERKQTETFNSKKLGNIVLKEMITLFFFNWYSQIHNYKKIVWEAKNLAGFHKIPIKNVDLYTSHQYLTRNETLSCRRFNILREVSTYKMRNFNSLFDLNIPPTRIGSVNDSLRKLLIVHLLQPTPIYYIKVDKRQWNKSK